MSTEEHQEPVESTKDDFLTVRVKKAVKDRLEEEQERVRKRAGKRPSLSEVIEAALDAASAKKSDPDADQTIGSIFEAWYRKARPAQKQIADVVIGWASEDTGKRPKDS